MYKISAKCIRFQGNCRSDRKPDILNTITSADLVHGLYLLLVLSDERHVAALAVEDDAVELEACVPDDLAIAWD